MKDCKSWESVQELVKSQEIIETDFAGRKLFEVGDIPNQKHPVFIGEHIAGLMHTDKGIMTIGICVKNKEKLWYKENKKIALAYAEDNKFFLTEGEIKNMRESNEKDLQELDMLFQSRMQSLKSVLGSIKFSIAEIMLLSGAKMQNRRQHLRIAVKWTVYFKIINPNAELKKNQQKWLSDKIFETSHSYFKSTTVDISAGGYKSIINAQLPEETEIDCVIEIMGKDNMKAVGRIKGQVLGCIPNQTRSNAYDMRVKFLDMTDDTMSVMKTTIEKHK